MNEASLSDTVRLCLRKRKKNVIVKRIILKANLNSFISQCISDSNLEYTGLWLFYQCRQMVVEEAGQSQELRERPPDALETSRLSCGKQDVGKRGQ
jgi:hypothetical protein